MVDEDFGVNTELVVNPHLSQRAHDSRGFGLPPESPGLTPAGKSATPAENFRKKFSRGRHLTPAELSLIHFPLGLLQTRNLFSILTVLISAIRSF